MKKILFILKHRCNYSGQDDISRNSGLYNSVMHIIKCLSGYEAVVEVVQDNNCIDRVLTEHKPNICIIEALWVVPNKFFELKRLHPNVTFMVRLHSDIPFLANEGVAISWIKEYISMNVIVALNSRRIYDSFRELFGHYNLIYLPNTYSMGKQYDTKPLIRCSEINIGCFGSIRPLKNQLMQAVAAMNFADENGLLLRFHINNTRMEQRGENNYKNILALFDSTIHELVENPWMEQEKFVEYIHTNIDIGMQVSYTETFNLVAANFVEARTPIIVSPEISWVLDYFKCDPNNERDIVLKLTKVYDYTLSDNDLSFFHRLVQKISNFNNNTNYDNLLELSKCNTKIWKKFIDMNVVGNA